MVQREEATLRGLSRQLFDPAEAEEWQSKGNALLTLPKNKWRHGLQEVEVPDWSRWNDDGSPVSMVVELDPEKDFQANAKAFFKKARKITRAVEKVTPMLEQHKEALERWRAHAEAAEAWRKEQEAEGGLSKPSEEAVLRLRSELFEEGALRLPPPPEPKPDPEEEARKAFKRKYGKDIECFRSPSGHEVVAGRSSKTNDYVSTKLAKGDLPWFHTDSGIPGSHVLVKAPWDSVAEEDFEFAAKIAAYYSKARDDLQVPVMYCRGEQVRKVKGARQGQVFVSGNAFQIYVTPGLPEE